jgi:hypothetical protein
VKRAVYKYQSKVRIEDETNPKFIYVFVSQYSASTTVLTERAAAHCLLHLLGFEWDLALHDESNLLVRIVTLWIMTTCSFIDGYYMSEDGAAPRFSP